MYSSLMWSLPRGIGFISHYKIGLKIPRQRIWRSAIKWDDELNDEQKVVLMVVQSGEDFASASSKMLLQTVEVHARRSGAYFCRCWRRRIRSVVLLSYTVSRRSQYQSCSSKIKSGSIKTRFNSEDGTSSSPNWSTLSR